MEKAREQKAVNDITNVGVSLMSAIRLRISIGDSVQSIPSSRHILFVHTGVNHNDDENGVGKEMTNICR